MNQCFFFSILRSGWTGHHAGEDFVKFGDRSDKQVENSGKPSPYWRQGRTACLKLASFLDFSEIFALGSSEPFFWVAEWRIFGQKKAHTAMNELSKLGTQVSKVYR